MRNYSTSQPPRKDVYQIITDKVISLLEQGTVIAPQNPFHQQVKVGFEPDRNGPVRNQLARFIMHEGAAACRQNHPVARQKPGNDTALSTAKELFAMLFEDFRNRLTRRAFNLGVGVTERHPELGCETASHC